MIMTGNYWMMNLSIPFHINIPFILSYSLLSLYTILIIKKPYNLFLPLNTLNRGICNKAITSRVR